MEKYIIVIDATLLVLNVSDLSMRNIQRQIVIILNVISTKVISLLNIIPLYALMKVTKKNGKIN